MSQNLRMKRDFSGAWPAVLEEMQDYINLQLMLAGGRRTVEMRVFISRQQVRADALSPHVNTLVTALRAISGSKVHLAPTDAAAHRVELDFWR